jgi:hypothetical protein
MTVNSKHPQYNEWIGTVNKCRSAIRGQKAIKSQTDLFLPKPGGMTTADYNDYLTRAIFVQASGRTVDALVGSIFRKKPQVAGVDVLEPWLSDIDLKGTTAFQFMADVVRDQIGVSRAGVLVDYSETMLRPVCHYYTAESIINWWQDFRDGMWVTSMVVLEENYIEREEVFTVVNKKQYRVLRLDENGLYVNEVYRETNDKNFRMEPALSVQPKIKGKPMSFIPFVCFNPTKLGFETEVPVIDGIVDLNIGHYRNYADLEIGRHYTGLPTPIITGINKQTDTNGYVIGGKTAWILPENATASFLEFKGDGLGNLERGLTSKEEQMSMLGARLIRSDKSGRGDSTATEWQIRNAGETSVLTMIANTAAVGFEIVFYYMARFAGVDIARDEVIVRLNTDFVSARLNSDEIRALTEAVQTGVLSPEAYVFNLASGEMLPEDVDIDKEVKRITEQLNKALDKTSTPDSGAVGNSSEVNDAAQVARK